MTQNNGLDEYLESLKSAHHGEDIDWENLTWNPDTKETPRDKRVAAEAYQQYLQERIDARKQSQITVQQQVVDSKKKITSKTARHPSMYDEGTLLSEIREKSPDRKTVAITARQAERWWIEQSRVNIACFMIYVWGLVPADHHIEWFKQMLNPTNEKTIIIGPRGSAKSTIALIFLSWYIGKFPHMANILISVTLKQAQDRLETLRDLIEYNVRFKKVFPDIAVDKKRPNNKTALNVKRTDISYSAWRRLVTRHSDAKSPTLFASGVGGSQVIGSRCSGILLLDDLMDERNIATEDLRNKLWTWVSQTLMPVLMKTARAIHITTRWHSDDLVIRQINTGQWSHSYTRALLKDAAQGVASYWPEQFPLSRLLDIRKTVGGPIFKLMYLCIPTALSGELFDIDMLRNGLPEELPAFRYVILSVDPALKAKHQADDTAMVVVGVPASMDAMYVLNMYAGKWKPETVASKVSWAWAKAWEDYGVEPILLMETVGAFELYAVLLQHIGVVNMQKFHHDNPVVDKFQRALPLGSLAEYGGLYFNLNDKLYHKVVSQMLEFTGDDGNPDDFVDALSQVAKRIRGSIKMALRKANTKLFKIPGIA
jgi:predicted phage terminase large subunit-like protein